MSDADGVGGAAGQHWDAVYAVYATKPAATVSWFQERPDTSLRLLTAAGDPAGMLTEMTRVVRPGGIVAVTDEVEHSYEWMRTEQADLWLGFSGPDVQAFFDRSRLAEYGYASLGMQ